MELNIFATILVAIVLVLLIIGIIIYNRNFRFKTYGIIEIIPSRQKDDQELVLKMESFISSLRSMPKIYGEYNVILDITNKDDVNTFRIIAPEPYIEDVSGIVRNHFSDFEINRISDIDEDKFLDPYSWGFVFRTDSSYPLIKMEKEENAIHHTKSIISSLKEGSFQIMIDFNTRSQNFITEEHLTDVQVGKTLASNNINFVKDLAVSFRFLSFSKSPNTSLLPSTVWALFNLWGTSNFLTKIYKNDSLMIQNIDGRSIIADALYNLFKWRLPRLSSFSSGDRMYYSARELCSLFSFVTGADINCINYRRCNPSNVLRIQKEHEAKISAEEFTTISEIDYPWFEGQHLKLSPEALRRHTYIVGKTGTWKSVLLSNLMMDDILKNRGFALLDPHGDLADKIMEMIPENRKDDVVYIDPSTHLWRINLSIFSFLRELKTHHEEHQKALYRESQKLNESDNAYQKIDITEHLMKEITLAIKNISVGWSAHWGARMDSIITNIGAEILRYNMGEIKDISSYLNFPEFRKNIVGNIGDQSLREEMSAFENMDKKTREESFQSVRNRFQIFLSDSMKDIFSWEPEISIRDILENNKIVILRLPKAELGPTASLVGILMINILWKFAQGRSNVLENERKDFTIYIDEVQNFITDDIASILEEARKYRLRLVMASQYTRQLADANSHVYNSLIGNIGTFIALGVGHDDSEMLSRYFDITPMDLQKIQPLHGYIKCQYYSSDTFNIKLKFVEKVSNQSYPGRIALMNLSHEKYGLKKVNIPSLRTYFETFEKLPPYDLTKAGYEYEVRKNECRLSQEDFSPNKLYISKVIIYIRTSTGPEENQVQIEHQENAIMEYIRKHNETFRDSEQLELIKIFQESSPANSPGREVFDEMINFIKEWHYNEILSLDESRLSRNSVDTETLNNLMDNWYIQNIRTISNDQYYTKYHKLP